MSMFVFNVVCKYVTIEPCSQGLHISDWMFKTSLIGDSRKWFVCLRVKSLIQKFRTCLCNDWLLSNVYRYITYAKEEEAIRCIQAVHNFVLEGKVLRWASILCSRLEILHHVVTQMVVDCCRACFGTTKYCHAWLRNMVQLLLHSDSFIF